MLLYSKTILTFIKKIRAHCKEIISEEMGLCVFKTRFEYQGHHIPLNIVVFEDDKELAHYDHSKMRLGFNKKLMHQASLDILKNIIRHELAHLIESFELKNSKNKTSPHGASFNNICRRFNWGPEVFKASINLTCESRNASDINYEKMINRIKKLLALASSSNKYESQQATLKANELLVKYNLKNIEDIQRSETDEEFCVKTVLEVSRNCTKLHCIYEVLEYFYVKAVFSRGDGKTCLEITGSHMNVELADYIAKFLWSEYDRFWKNAQLEHPELKGISHKNSFFTGLTKGFIKKLKQQKANSGHTAALIKIEKNLEHAVKMAYPHLGSTRTNSRLNSQTQSIGVIAGNSLNIRPAIQKKSSRFLASLA